MIPAQVWIFCAKFQHKAIVINKNTIKLINNEWNIFRPTINWYDIDDITEIYNTSQIDSIATYEECQKNPKSKLYRTVND